MPGAVMSADTAAEAGRAPPDRSSPVARMTPTLTKACTSPPRSELGRTVRLSEETRRVIALAFGVRLMALNAIILARRAGASARGFGVLSGELRRFTGELESAMDELRRLTWSAVATVTARVKQARVAGVLERARAAAPQSERWIDEPLARMARAAESQAAELRATERALQEAIRDADRIGLMGGVLARTARIEAAYGDVFRVQLTEVADGFDRAIASILASLQQLESTEMGARS